MIENFKFIDLFCGIGGFHQAMESLGGECVFASDIDAECQKIYKQNYGIDVIGDITKVNAEDIPSFNVLCAGFPCQAFSQGGKQLGFNDPTRGTLFFDVIRIARHHKPEYMLLENVKNLASHDNGNTWKVIYNTIQDAGYNVAAEPVIFSPHFLGIPQNRERVFIMCKRKDLGDLPQFVFDSSKKSLPHCSIDRVLMDDKEIPNIEKYRISPKLEEMLQAWDDFVKGTNGDMYGHICIDFLRDSKDEEVYSKLEPYMQHHYDKCMEFYQKHKSFIDQWKATHLNVEMFKDESRRHIEWQTDRGEGQTIWKHLMQLRQSGLRVKRPTMFPTLVAIVQSPIIGKYRRYITPREAARLQSFPDSFQMHPDDHTAYKQFGNSVNVAVVYEMAKFLFGDPETRARYGTK